MSIKVSEISKEIIRLCKERNITSYELAKRSGLNNSSVRNMTQKGTTPTYKTLSRMCYGLGITVSQFFNQSDFLEKLSPEERELMEFYLKMDRYNRQRLLQYAREILAIQNSSQTPKQ